MGSQSTWWLIVLTDTFKAVVISWVLINPCTLVYKFTKLGEDFVMAGIRVEV